jgi:hypothetical protein
VFTKDELHDMVTRSKAERFTMTEYADGRSDMKANEIIINMMFEHGQIEEEAEDDSN